MPVFACQLEFLTCRSFRKSKQHLFIYSRLPTICLIFKNFTKHKKSRKSAIVVDDMESLKGQGLDEDVHELKLSECKLLLAIIESRQDLEIYNRIYRSVGQGPRQLLKSMVVSYQSRHLNSAEIETVGHSLYILLYQLSKRNFSEQKNFAQNPKCCSINFQSIRKVYSADYFKIIRKLFSFFFHFFLQHSPISRICPFSQHSRISLLYQPKTPFGDLQHAPLAVVLKAGGNGAHLL